MDDCDIFGSIRTLNIVANGIKKFNIFGSIKKLNIFGKKTKRDRIKINKVKKLKKILQRDDLNIEDIKITIIRYNHLEKDSLQFDEIYQGENKINIISASCHGIEKEFDEYYDEVGISILEYIYKIVDDGKYKNLEKTYKKLEKLFDIRYIYKKDDLAEDDSVENSSGGYYTC